MLSDANRLAAIDAFSDLPDAELDELALLAIETSLPAGHELLAEGDEPWELVAIERGTAAVERGGQPLAAVGPGDVVGEIGLLQGRARTATVRATSPMSLLLLTEWDLDRLRRTAPMAIERLRALAARRSALAG